MKKYMRFLSLLLALMLLVSCSGGTTETEPETNIFTPPAPPEGFLDGAVAVSVSVGDFMVIRELTGAQDYIDEYHGGSVSWSTLLSIDPEAGTLSYSRSDTKVTGDLIRTYSLDREGGEYSLSEALFPTVSRNPFSSKEDFERTADVYAHFTGEQVTGNLLAVIGDTVAPRQLSEDMLTRVLGYSASAADSPDHTGKVRSILATFTCEELATMLGELSEDGSLSTDATELWGSFFDRRNNTSLADRIRVDGSFSLSLRISADAQSGVVELADITAKGAGTRLSLVYDGTTGDLEISVKRTGIETDYTKKHEDGRITTTLSTETEGDTASTEKQLKLIETDGAIYFSSEKIANGKTLKSAVKYDSSTNTYTLKGADLTLTLTAKDGSLTGEARNTKTQQTATLTFKSETTEGGRAHTLTHVGETDVSSAGVVFRIEK